MTTEGMWSIQSGQVGSETKPMAGGIVTLETGRVLGGDGVMAYLGTFEVNGDKIIARVQTWQWNNAWDETWNVFGVSSQQLTRAANFQVILEGTRKSENLIVGELYPVNAPTHRLAAIMEKITDLP